MLGGCPRAVLNPYCHGATAKSLLISPISTVFWFLKSLRGRELQLADNGITWRAMRCLLDSAPSAEGLFWATGEGFYSN